MRVTKLPLERHWIEQELMPYLRCAFSHELVYDDDIKPTVLRAIDFTFKKAVKDFPTDGDDLVFERICQAIQFRYKNLAPDLSVVTDNMESLAKFLLRHAQLKGSYELLGRMNVASGAWREYEAWRLECLRLAAEKEKNDGPLLIPDPPSKLAPTEDQIDPRLIDAIPGQYVAPSLSGTLTVTENQHYRQSNKLLSNYRQQQRREQHSATSALPHHRSPRDPTSGWASGQQYVNNAVPAQTLLLSYVQSLGQRKRPHPMQAMPNSENINPDGPICHAKPFDMLQQPYTPAASAQPAMRPASQYCNAYAQPMPAPQPQQMRQYPVQPMSRPGSCPTSGVQTSPMAPATSAMPAASAAHWLNSTATAIPTADIAHLRGNQWTEAVGQRARDFKLQLHQQPKMSMQELSDPANPAGVFGRAAASNMYQPAPSQPQRAHHQPQQFALQMQPDQGGQGFANHPGYSNVMSAFPDLNNMYDWSIQKPSPRHNDV